MFAHRWPKYLVFPALALATCLPAASQAQKAEPAPQPPAVTQAPPGESAILRKRPGRTKYNDITLKRGYASTDRIGKWRKSLRPQSSGEKLRALRRTGWSDDRRLNRQIDTLDRLLRRWEQSVRTFERLRARRNMALKRGMDTSRLDKRLDAQLREMGKRAEAVRNQADRVSTRFQALNKKKNQSSQNLSRIMKTLQELRALGAASRSGL